MESLLLIKILAFIAAFLALAYGVVVTVKNKPKSLSHKRLDILEYQKIDPKNSLCLIRSDDHEFLVAMGPASIAIHPITIREK